jgi:cytochrome oxidase Cu insertion factor (SCO1/SenC/PrrC family)
MTVDPCATTQIACAKLAAFSELPRRHGPGELAAVQKAYGVVAKHVVSRNPALEYAVDHSSSLYLVDRQGKLRGLTPFGTPAEDIAHDLELMLKMGHDLDCCNALGCPST